MMHPIQARNRRPGGFTLVEVIVVLAVAAVMMSFGFPALQTAIHRSKLEGAARTTAAMMRNARFEAIKQSLPVVVLIDTTNNDVLAFVDTNADSLPDVGELRLGRLILPAGVLFDGPGAQTFSDGLDATGTTAWASFINDGSVTLAGAFRIADSRDNFLEVRVAPPATARIQLRKWDGSQWRYQGEGELSWNWY